MQCIKGFLQKIDVFGVSYSFKHKKSEKYNTSLGGFIFLLFIVVVIIFGIYYFIPFYNRKNFSIIYYSMNMPVTDTIKLSESKASFAIGLECPFEEKTQVSGKIYLIFNLHILFIQKITMEIEIKSKIYFLLINVLMLIFITIIMIVLILLVLINLNAWIKKIILSKAFLLMKYFHIMNLLLCQKIIQLIFSKK